MKTPLVREQLTLRLPPALHRCLKVVAVDNGRSLNAEIVKRLQRSLDGIDSPGGVPAEAPLVVEDCAAGPDAAPRRHGEPMSPTARHVLNVVALREDLPLDGWSHYLTSLGDNDVSVFYFDRRADGRTLKVRVTDDGYETLR